MRTANAKHAMKAVELKIRFKLDFIVRGLPSRETAELALVRDFKSTNSSLDAQSGRDLFSSLIVVAVSCGEPARF
jgi:hypothetical protein